MQNVCSKNRILQKAPFYAVLRGFKWSESGCRLQSENSKLIEFSGFGAFYL
jgi:hypothetical protein